MIESSGATQERISKKLYLYTDEAGNTGADLFNDAHQPFFYTSTIFSDCDIDINDELKSDFEEIIGTLQLTNPKIKEIHFTKLSEDEKSFVTEKIVDMLHKYDLKLLISIIEKKYLPKLLFINEFFDSGVNPMVHPDVYNIRFHRFFLVFGITKKFTDEESKLFYELFKSMDKEEMILFIKDIKPRLIADEPDEYKILVDSALSYVVDNIDDFIFKLDKKYLLPNYHILNSIMHYTREIYSDVEAIFKHDHNSNILKGLPEKLLPVSFKWDADTSAFSSIADIREDKTFNNGISFIDSQESFGIQVADIFVSFFRLYHEGKIKNIKKFEKIIECIDDTPFVGISNQITINEICSYEEHIHSMKNG